MPGVVIRLLILLLIGIASAKSLHAQVSPVSDDQVLKACEACADKVRELQAKVTSLETQLELVKGREQLKDEKLAFKDEQIAYWKTAATERKGALSTDDRLFNVTETQLSECKAEVSHLRHPNIFSRLFNPDVLAAGAGGFFIGNARK